MRWAVAIASLTCACCVGTVDRVVMVRLRPVDETGRQYTRCAVALSDSRSDAVFEEARSIGQGEELEAVVHRDRDARKIVPIVRCESASEDYVGEEVGRLRSSIDLGEIVIAGDATK